MPLNYEMEEYLMTVRDTKQQRWIPTTYRLSVHSLAIERCRHRKTLFPREERLCAHCKTDEVETEVHFLLHCHKLQTTRDIYMDQFTNYITSQP